MIKLKKRKSPFLIAELGINHNGSLMLAKELIDLAKKCQLILIIGREITLTMRRLLNPLTKYFK